MERAGAWDIARRRPQEPPPPSRNGEGLLQDLSEQDRQALADLINQFAHQETDPERQLTAWEAPETLDLLA
ncbi:hypothetical protein [Nonomuraea sp. NPDC050643]|uniref:hypothetical protein n=1 Tax=Nonomuraea sp. NPDC050643 TaxID=3155660 RepID=UPI00340E421B